MRELVLENAGGKWCPSQGASYMLLADKDLSHVGQPFPDRCERGKCKDRAYSGSRTLLQINRSCRPIFRNAVRAWSRSSLV